MADGLRQGGIDQGSTGHVHRYQPPADTDKIFIFSDSTLINVMRKIGAPGDAQESRSPKATLAVMQAYLNQHPVELKGKTVILSSLTNNLDDHKSLAGAIDLAQSKGAKVVVLGMGDYHNRYNPQLKSEVEAKGAQFVPLGANDGNHSTNTETLTNSILAAAKLDAATLAPDAPAARASTPSEVKPRIDKPLPADHHAPAHRRQARHHAHAHEHHHGHHHGRHHQAHRHTLGEYGIAHRHDRHHVRLSEAQQLPHHHGPHHGPRV